MVRKVVNDWTYDDWENEILFTIAALEADPDASDLVPRTATWMSMVDAARAQDRAARVAAFSASAHRSVANARLDSTCRQFGRELAADLGNDRQSPRWRRFFGGPVGDFVGQPLGDQAAACIAWLSVEDAVLTRLRPRIETWAHAAQSALVRTRDSAQARGNAIVVRESTAENLTRARDALHATLVARAAERGLERDFADGFFIVETKRRRSPAANPNTNEGA